MLLLFFIFTAELLQARLALILPEISQSWAIPLIFLLYFFQFFFAPLQGGFSDFYCRRKSLIFAFFMIAIAELCLYISLRQPNIWLIASIILFGMLGNADVIAKAALLDTKYGKNRRVVLGASFIAQSIAWIFVAILIKIYPHMRISLFALATSLLAILLSFFVFEDKRDLPNWRANYSFKSELLSMVIFLKNKNFTLGFIAFLFTQAAFFIAFLFPDAFFSRNLEWKFAIYFSAGFAFGILFQMFAKFTDKNGIMWGISIAISSILIGWFLNSLHLKNEWLELGFDYFIFMMGIGIFLPCMYSLYSKGHGLHEQGKLFGLLMSIQTMGAIIATLLLINWKNSTPGSIQAIVAIIFFTAFILYQKRLHISVG